MCPINSFKFWTILTEFCPLLTGCPSGICVHQISWATGHMSLKLTQQIPMICCVHYWLTKLGLWTHHGVRVCSILKRGQYDLYFDLVLRSKQKSSPLRVNNFNSFQCIITKLGICTHQGVMVCCLPKVGYWPSTCVIEKSSPLHNINSFQRIFTKLEIWTYHAVIAVDNLTASKKSNSLRSILETIFCTNWNIFAEQGVLGSHPSNSSRLYCQCLFVC